MNNKELSIPRELIDSLNYEDGLLYWKEKKTRRRVGVPAGRVSHQGYVQIGFKNKRYGAHRIVWTMFNGAIPRGFQIDHENHNRSDNRIANLRLATYKTNGSNSSLNCRNKSGVTGVIWRKGIGAWQAQIKISGKYKYLGLFNNLFDAVCARKSAEIKHGFHCNHGKAIS